MEWLGFHPEEVEAMIRGNAVWCASDENIDIQDGA
jgi:hypothetical protein